MPRSQATHSRITASASASLPLALLSRTVRCSSPYYDPALTLRICYLRCVFYVGGDVVADVADPAVLWYLAEGMGLGGGEGGFVIVVVLVIIIEVWWRQGLLLGLGCVAIASCALSGNLKECRGEQGGKEGRTAAW